MANRYWVGGNASWDGTAGTKWSTTSGGAGGAAVPTSADDVFFDANSGAVSVTCAAGNTGCRTLNFNGFTGQFNGSAGLSIYGSLDLGSTMAGIGYSGTFTFAATTPGWTIDYNGWGPNNIPWVFDGVGGAWTLVADAIAKHATLTRGTLNLNGYTLTVKETFWSSNSNTRALNFGSGTLKLSNPGGGVDPFLDFTTATNLTVTPGTGTIEISDGSWYGGSIVSPSSVTLPSLRVSGGSGPVSISADASIDNLTLTSGYTGIFQNSALTIRGGISMNAANGTPEAGSGAWTFTSTSVEYLNSAGKTLDFPVVFNGAGGQWALSAGLTAGDTVTLTQGTLNLNGYTLQCEAFSSSNSNTREVYFGGGTLELTGTAAATLFNCATSTNLTVTLSGVAEYITVTGVTANTRSLDGGAKAWPHVTISGGSGAVVFYYMSVWNLTLTAGYTGELNNATETTVRGSLSMNAANGNIAAGADLKFTSSFPQTINTAGNTVGCNTVFDGTGTWTLSNDFVTAGSAISLTKGTLDTAGYSLSAGNFFSSGSNTRAIQLGSGWHVFSVAWSCSGSGLTVTAGSSTINVTSATTTFGGGDQTYNNVRFTAPGGTKTVQGSNTFDDLFVQGPTTLKFTSGTTNTFVTFSVNGTPGNLITLTSTTAALHYLVASTYPPYPLADNTYLDISWSDASDGAAWRAGTGSIDSGNNTPGGWFDEVFVITLDDPDVAAAAAYAITLKFQEQTKLEAPAVAPAYAYAPALNAAANPISEANRCYTTPPYPDVRAYYTFPATAGAFLRAKDPAIPRIVFPTGGGIGEFTMAFWVRRSSVPSVASGTLVHVTAGDAEFRVSITAITAANRIRLLMDDGTLSATDTAAAGFTADVWHFLLVGYDEDLGEVRAYVDGDLAATIDVSGLTVIDDAVVDMTIGADTDGTDLIDFDLTNVALFNYLISGAQALSLFGANRKQQHDYGNATGDWPQAEVQPESYLRDPQAEGKIPSADCDGSGWFNVGTGIGQGYFPSVAKTFGDVGDGSPTAFGGIEVVRQDLGHGSPTSFAGVTVTSLRDEGDASPLVGRSGDPSVQGLLGGSIFQPLLITTDSAVWEWWELGKFGGVVADGGGQVISLGLHWPNRGPWIIQFVAQDGTRYPSNFQGAYSGIAGQGQLCYTNQALDLLRVVVPPMPVGVYDLRCTHMKNIITREKFLRVMRRPTYEEGALAVRSHR